MAVVVGQVNLAEASLAEQIGCDEEVVFGDLDLVELALPLDATSLGYGFRCSLRDRALRKRSKERTQSRMAARRYAQESVVSGNRRKSMLGKIDLRKRCTRGTSDAQLEPRTLVRYGRLLRKQSNESIKGFFVTLEAIVTFVCYLHEMV